MSDKGKFYMTTAIAYTSGKPHIGNTYEIVLADAIARYKRLEGYDVYFQTGTDEHGQKIQEKAEKAGITPKEYVDNVAGEVKRIWDLMNTSYDNFVRTDLQNSLTVWNVTGPGQPTEGTTTGLYDLDKLKVYDKYAMFLHGNNGLSRVQGNGSGRILVIKDSYANCFVPYLTANYADIDVVDFRNYNYGLDQLITDNGYDQILVLYNFDSFKSDPYLYRAGVQG